MCEYWMECAECRKFFSMIFPYWYFEIPWFFRDFGLFFKFHDFSRSGKCIFHFPGFLWFSRPLGTLYYIFQQNYQTSPILWAHHASCTAGSHASLSICLSVEEMPFFFQNNFVPWKPMAVGPELAQLRLDCQVCCRSVRRWLGGLGTNRHQVKKFIVWYSWLEKNIMAGLPNLAPNYYNFYFTAILGAFHYFETNL